MNAEEILKQLKYDLDPLEFPCYTHEQVLMAMEEYRNQPSPDVHDIHVVNKEELRERFYDEFNDCGTVKGRTNKVFMWFWNNLHPVIDGADVRNKLGPFKNLLKLLENENVKITYTASPIKSIIEGTIEQCKINLEYLSSLPNKDGWVREDDYSVNDPIIEGCPDVPMYAAILPVFMKYMQKELEVNWKKGDRNGPNGWIWCNDKKFWLSELYYHVGKLQSALMNNDTERIKENTADIANIAMMILDINILLLPLPEIDPRILPTPKEER